MFIGIFGSESSADSKKLKDPRMTTEDNPFFSGRPSAEDLIACRNTKRLMKDAKLRSCPFNGHVYEGMMSTRYKQGE